MNSLQSKIQQWAHQVDRKGLKAEEADHLRLDLLAHEKVQWNAQFPTHRSSFENLRRFATTALALFLLFFTLTNAPAYGKMALASLQENWQNHQNSQPLTPLTVLENDPWTGAKHQSEALLATEPRLLAPQADYELPPLAAPVSYENRIQIPTLDINAPIVEPSLGLSALQNKDWAALEEQIHSALTQGVVHFPGTAEPGQQGNAFLTGHSSNVLWEQSAYNTVFALLPKIKIGDEIWVTYNQTEYRYTVTERKEVSPKDVSVLKQGEGKTLTLVTCTPVGTTLRRLVVTAVLNEN
ncbi:class D sortase [Candidatus Peregrinibacteria bacterium]|nr:MAG: class D sortase [Candidatus Peregrinibacteria bacterium]